MAAPLCLFFFLLIISLASSHNLSSDHTILLSLKQHWGNPPSLHSWNSRHSPCTVPGAECASGSIIGLFLANKNISGTIPPTICHLRNLVRIILSNNKLFGHIPACLYNCSNLQVLDLSMNELSGTIPGELFLMQKLQYLNISANRLFSGMPTTIQAYSLETIDLSYNSLSGTIPDETRNMYNLEWLDLHTNLFGDSIPRGLFQYMHRLFYISLAYNNFTGDLPAELDLFSLQELNLTHNRLYGVIPERFGYFERFTSLDLSDNQLSGDIVQSFCRLRAGTVVRLCSNKFIGKIPVEFVNKDSRNNCLDRSNLCSCNKNESLPDCPSNLCSDFKTRDFLNCNVESHKHGTPIIAGTIGTGIGAVGFVIFCYLARKCWKMARANIVSRLNRILPSTCPLNDKDKEWKMISFQNLDFSKSDILSSLTDDNLIGVGYLTIQIRSPETC